MGIAEHGKVGMGREWADRQRTSGGYVGRSNEQSGGYGTTPPVHQSRPEQRRNPEYQSEPEQQHDHRPGGSYVKHDASEATNDWYERRLRGARTETGGDRRLAQIGIALDNRARTGPNCWSVLRKDKELILLTVLSTAGFAFVARDTYNALFVDIGLFTKYISSPLQLFYDVVFVILRSCLLLSLPITFTTAAFVAGMHQRMSGGDPSLLSSIGTASRSIVSLAIWSAISFFGLLCRVLFILFAQDSCNRLRTWSCLVMSFIVLDRMNVFRACSKAWTLSRDRQDLKVRVSLVWVSLLLLPVAAGVVFSALLALDCEEWEVSSSRRRTRRKCASYREDGSTIGDIHEALPSWALDALWVVAACVVFILINMGVTLDAFKRVDLYRRATNEGTTNEETNKDIEGYVW